MWIFCRNRWQSFNRVFFKQCEVLLHKYAEALFIHSHQPSSFYDPIKHCLCSVTLYISHRRHWKTAPYHSPAGFLVILQLQKVPHQSNFNQFLQVSVTHKSHFLNMPSKKQVQFKVLYLILSQKGLLINSVGVCDWIWLKKKCLISEPRLGSVHWKMKIKDLHSFMA